MSSINKITSISLSEEHRESLRAFAKSHGVTSSALIRMLIEQLPSLAEHLNIVDPSQCQMTPLARELTEATKALHAAKSLHAPKLRVLRGIMLTEARRSPDRNTAEYQKAAAAAHKIISFINEHEERLTKAKAAVMDVSPDVLTR